MKYAKGTFVVIPNKEHLRGKPAEMQSIYFWLCDHSNEDGECFPTKSKISRDSGCSHNTVDKYLKQLVEEGFVTIEQRKKKGSKENTSNLYQLQILGEPPTNIGMTPPPKIGSETEPSINSTHLTLPISRGKTPASRILSIYRDCFKYIYGFEYKPNFARDLKILKDLTQTYTELQLARLITIFMSWHGMNGTDERDYSFLTGCAFPIAMFKANIPKYEAYIRNVLKEDFEDETQMFNEVGNYITNLK